MQRQSMVIAGLASLMVAAAGGCNVLGFIGQERAVRTESFTLPIPATGKCVVRTVNGQIRCVAAPVSEISVEAKVTARGKSVEQAERNLDQILLDGTEKDGVANVVAIVPRGTYGSVSITLTIPAEMMLELQSSNGGIDVSGVTGSVSGTTSNGGVHVTDCLGPINVRSSNGKLTVKGDVLVAVQGQTSNGTIEVDGVLAPGRHKLQTSNGSVNVSLRGHPVAFTATTSNGSIKANGAKVKKGQRMILGGTTAADLPLEGEAAELSISTSNGSVNVSHSGPAEEMPLELEASAT